MDAGLDAVGHELPLFTNRDRLSTANRIVPPDRLVRVAPNALCLIELRDRYAPGYIRVFLYKAIENLNPMLHNGGGLGHPKSKDGQKALTRFVEQVVVRLERRQPGEQVDNTVQPLGPPRKEFQRPQSDRLGHYPRTRCHPLASSTLLLRVLSDPCPARTY